LQNLIDHDFMREVTEVLKEYYTEGNRICTQILFAYTSNNDFINVWRLYSTHGKVTIGEPIYYSYYELKGIIERARLRQSKAAEVS